MNENIQKAWRLFRSRGEDFKGDKALYWAGKMAQCVRLVENSTPVNLSDNVALLVRCTDMYDGIMFSRVK